MAVEFKLVGGLTVRQFFFLALGVGSALIFYKSDLPLIFKGPITLLLGFFGIASAFLPIQDRSFDIWIKNFIKSVYSPTQRIWKKEPEPPSYFLTEYAEILKHEVLTLAPTKSRKRLASYLEGIHEEQKNKIDRRIDNFLEKIKYDVEPPEKLKKEEEARKKEERLKIQKEKERLRRAKIEKQKLEDQEALAKKPRDRRGPKTGKTPEGKEPPSFSKKEQARLRKKLEIPKELPLIITSKEDVMEMPKIKTVKPGRELKNLPLLGGEIVLPSKERRVMKERTKKPLIRKIEELEEARKNARTPSETAFEMKGIEIKPKETHSPSPILMQKLEDLRQTIEEIRNKQGETIKEAEIRREEAESPIRAPEKLIGIVPRREVRGTMPEESQVKKETEELKHEIEYLGKRTAELKEIVEKVPGIKPSDIDTIEFYKEQIKLLEEENKELEKRLKYRKDATKLLSDLEEQNKKYQQQLDLMRLENKKLAEEIAKGKEELEKLKSKRVTTESEKKLQEKRIKLQEERLKELSKEKINADAKVAQLKQQLESLRKQPRKEEEKAAYKSEPEAVKQVREKRVRKVEKESAKGREPKVITDIPNVINGHVKDNRGQLLKGAVVIIKDNEGNPVRALKTNELGQFSISTPLPNGTYTVETSYPEQTFDILEIEIDGTVPPPLEFEAK